MFQWIQYSVILVFSLSLMGCGFFGNQYSGAGERNYGTADSIGPLVIPSDLATNTQLDPLYPIPVGPLSEYGADPIDDWPAGASHSELPMPENPEIPLEQQVNTE